MPSVTKTAANVHIPDVFVQGVIAALEAETTIQNDVDRSWDFVGHGDIYRKARFPNLTVAAKAETTPLTPQAYTDTEQTIQINTYVASAVAIEDNVKVLSQNDLRAEFMKKMGYAMARKIDVDLAGLAGSFPQVVGTYGVEATFETLLSAIALAAAANYDPTDGFVFYVSAPQYYALIKDDRFSNADYVGQGNAEGANRKGLVGMCAGVPVKMSNLLTVPAAGQHDNFLLKDECVALIMAMEPKVTTQVRALEADEVIVMSEIYGYSQVTRYSEAPGNTTATNEGCVLVRGI